MNRVLQFKIGYVIVLVLLALAVGFLYVHSGRNIVVLAVAALLLWVPGRIQGLYFKDLFAGRNLLSAGRAEEAVPCFDRFISTVRQHPWRSWLLWLSWSIYTPNALAMGLNNLGAAYLDLGRLDEAEAAFNEAAAQDPGYPLPHFNKAVCLELRGNREAAAKAAGVARRLGYSDGALDAVVRTAQLLRARVEGSGTKV